MRAWHSFVVSGDVVTVWIREHAEWKDLRMVDAFLLGIAPIRISFFGGFLETVAGFGLG